MTAAASASDKNTARTIAIRHADNVLLGRVVGLDGAPLGEVVLHPGGDGEVVAEVMIEVAGGDLHGVVLSVEGEDLVHEVPVVSGQVLCPVGLPRGGQQVHAVATGAW